MKPTNHPRTGLIASFLAVSLLSLNAGEALSVAGHLHPLARASGAEPWPKTIAPGVPAGLIWRSEGRPRGVILCLHGIQTHAAWFGPLARELRRDGWTIIAPDRRGSGVNVTPPFLKGHASGAKELLRDLDGHMELAWKEAGNRPLLLLGTSWGSNLAGAWLATTSEPLPAAFIQLVPATRTQFDLGPFRRLLVGTMNLFAKEKTAKVTFGREKYLPTDQPSSRALLSWKILEYDSRGETDRNAILLAEPTYGTIQAGLTLNRRARHLLAHGVTIPILVIQASGDQIMKNEDSWKVVSHKDRDSGQASRIVLEGGHGIQLDDPKGVAGAIAQWEKLRLK